MLSSSSSSSPSSLWSVAEFGDLVAHALNGERFSESLLELRDPERTNVPSLSTFFSPMVSPSSPQGRTVSGSRPRLLLEKLKQQASALVLRPKEVSKPACPYIHISHSASFITGDEFTPYLPLVAQYERAALKSNTHTIFSRPASAVTASTTTPFAIPSSPTSISTDPLSPKTPSFNSSSSSSLSSYSCSSASRSRWSLCTDDSIPTPYPLFRDHPFARSNIVADADPFAKGSVQVVPRTAPPKPPPSRPLPRPPNGTRTEMDWTRLKETEDRMRGREDEDRIQVRETEEWTLKLGLSFPLAPPEPTNITTQPTSLLHPHSEIKPKPKILRIQIEPENALDVDKEDWTLSLPLSLSTSAGTTQPTPSSSAPSSALTFLLPVSDRENVRPRYRSQPGPVRGRSESSPGKGKGKKGVVRERVSVESLPHRDVPNREAPFAGLKTSSGGFVFCEECRRAATAAVTATAPPTTPSGVGDPPLSTVNTLEDNQTSTKIKFPDKPGTAESVSSTSTVMPGLVQRECERRREEEKQKARERELNIEYALSSASVRSSYSFADSGVGMSGVIMVGGDGDGEMGWVDRVRLPSTPNLIMDPEMMGWGGRGSGEKEVDRMSMVSGHSMYYSACSCLEG